MDEYTFYDIENIGSKAYALSYHDKLPEVRNSVVQYKLYRDNIEILHERKVYSIQDLMGDLGGVIEILLVVFSIFLCPISEHSFNVQAIKKLYLARTTDDWLFLPSKNAHRIENGQKNEGGDKTHLQ